MNFPSVSVKTRAPFQLVHTDVWGPSSIPSVDGFKYYIHFVDDFTRFTWIFPLRAKSEVHSIFVNFNSYVERQFCTKILCLQSDWGREYRRLSSLLLQLGIKFRHPCPYTH